MTTQLIAVTMPHVVFIKCFVNIINTYEQTSNKVLAINAKYMNPNLYITFISCFHAGIFFT